MFKTCVSPCFTHIIQVHLPSQDLGTNFESIEHTHPKYGVRCLKQAVLCPGHYHPNDTFQMSSWKFAFSQVISIKQKQILHPHLKQKNT